jgi:hypothetical protein
MLLKKIRDEGVDIIAVNKRTHDFCLSPYRLDLKNHFYFGSKITSCVLSKTTPVVGVVYK